MNAVLAYSTNDLIDTVAAVIIDVQATPARWSAEVAATKTMLVRTEECFGLKVGRLATDAAYGSGLMIGWLQRGITPQASILDHDQGTKGLFTRTAFQFDTAQNHNICPGGSSPQELRSGSRRRPRPYLASTKDCRACTLRPRCTTGTKASSGATCSRRNASKVAP
jgi:hypothetical protein